MKLELSLINRSVLSNLLVASIALFAYNCDGDPMQTIDNVTVDPNDHADTDSTLEALPAASTTDTTQPQVVVPTNTATCTNDPAKRVVRGTSVARVVDATDIGTEEDAGWDVYESNNIHPNSEAWIGNGGSVAGSYTGLRFRKISIPAGAKVESARLALNHPVNNTSGQWIGVAFDLFGEKNRTPVDFAVGQTLVSARPRTTAVTTFSQDFRWELGIEWVLDVTAIVKELATPSLPKSVALLSHGMATGQWGRMFFQPIGDKAPRLEVTYVKTLPLCPPPSGGGGPTKHCFTCTHKDGSRAAGCGTKERCTPGTYGCESPKEPCPGGSEANACTDC